MSTTSLKKTKSRSKSTTFKLDEAEDENRTSKTMSESERFSKDIVVEDFYVLKDDEYEAFEFETKSSAGLVRKVSIMIPEKDKPQQEDFDLSQAPQEDGKEKEKVDEAEKKESVSEMDELMKKKEETTSIDIPDKDFFNKEDEDADKTLVLKEISGMTEEVTVDEDEEEEEKKETKEEIKEEEVKDNKVETKPEATETEKPIIHFEAPEETAPEITSVAASSVEEDRSISIDQRRDSKESIEPRPTLTRRPSGIPDLIKLSRKSLLALTMKAGGVPGKKSVEDKTKDADGIVRSSADLLGLGIDPRVSKAESRKSQRRSTVFEYKEVSARYRQFSEDDYITGFDLDTDSAPIFFEDFQEEEEHIIEEEEVVHEFLERGPYYERHDKAVQEIALKKLKYFILQKKLAMYFKRKKMDYATKETDWSFDTQSKFYKKLEAYGELINYVALEKCRVTTEIENTKKERNEQFTKLTSMFQTLQDREVEIGHGLIFTKTANVIPEKMVERLIRRQHCQMAQVSSMRLTFIRLKDMVQEKLNSIAALDEIAPGFLLADYEQLKTDGRGYADKIEEKDEELNKLRAKCGSTIQVLAHFREKSAALACDLDDLLDECEEKEAAFFRLRSNINQNKQMRDIVRNTITKMRDDSGLLTQPTLLRDMEHGLIEIKELTNQLNKLTRDYKKRARQIKTIRFKIEQGVEDIKRITSKKSLQSKSKNKSVTMKDIKPQGQLYKGRPSLLVAEIDQRAFDSLSTIKPKLTYDRSQRNNRINIKHSKKVKE